VLSLLAAGTASCTTYCRVALLEYAIQAHSKGNGQNLTTEVAVGPAADQRHGRGWALGPVGGLTWNFKDPDASPSDTPPMLLYAGMKVHYYLYRIGAPWPISGGEKPELVAVGTSLTMSPAWISGGKDGTHGLRGVLTEGELFARLTYPGIVVLKLSVGAELAPEFSGVFARISFGLAPTVLGRSEPETASPAVATD
jgi:hypothetical protein